MKILFFGTGTISKSFLENLYQNGHQILCITMPDKPALRGQKLTPPQVKVFAQGNNLDFIQPGSFSKEIIERISFFNADVGIAVAYGKIIPQEVFDLPKYKTFNIHFSLLPKYRGAAPVQYCLLSGDKETGVSAFFLEKTLDSGAIIVQDKLSIEDNDNAITLFDKLITLGITTMNKALKLLQTGVKPIPQEGIATFAKTLKKEDGKIDWSKSAKQIINQMRGLCIWPGTYSIVSTGKLKDKRIKFIEAKIIDDDTTNRDYAKVVSFEKGKGFVVLCAKGKILFTKVQPENKPVMNAWDFIQSGKLLEGDFFTK